MSIKPENGTIFRMSMNVDIFFRVGRLARPASSPNLRPQSPSRPSLLRHHARVTRDLLDGWESASVLTRFKMLQRCSRAVFTL